MSATPDDPADLPVPSADDAIAFAGTVLAPEGGESGFQEPSAGAPQGEPGEAAPEPAGLVDGGLAAVNDAAATGLAELDEAVKLVSGEVATVADMVNEGVVNPVRDAANEALAAAPALFGEDERPEELPQTGASVAPVGDSALTGTLIVAGAAAAAGAAALIFWLAGSSGTVGAGGAGALASRGKDLRHLLPFASPLFTRFERDTVLGHPKREALYALIMQNPGISLQALGDQTGLSRTAVNHHLRLLELQHLIVSKRLGRSRHYYENGGRYQTHQKEAYALLQNDRSKEIATFIQDHPGAIQRDLCKALGLQASIAHWHVKRLVEVQLVEAVRHGRTVSYFPGPALREVAHPVAAAAPAAAVIPA